MGAGVAVGDDDVTAEARRLDDRQQVAVADDRPDPLALQHLAELRSGEAGVQVDAGEAGLRGGDRHRDEVAMVRAQHAEVVATVEAERPEPVRQL